MWLSRFLFPSQVAPPPASPFWSVLSPCALGRSFFLEVKQVTGKEQGGGGRADAEQSLCLGPGGHKSLFTEAWGSSNKHTSELGFRVLGVI